MAKRKQSKASKKVVKQNLITAVAITSVLLNLFFITGIIIYSSTNQIDYELLVETQNNFCDEEYDKHVEVVTRNAIDPELEKANLEVVCVNGEFKPYHQQAVDEYLRDLGY